MRVEDLIKQKLLEDTNLIEGLLEELNCHSFKFSNDKLTCCLPDGDNSRSVQVYFNEYMKVQVWTRNTFEDFEYKDFISLVQFLLDTSYTRTKAFLCNRLEIDCENITTVKRSDAMKKIKSFKTNVNVIKPHSFLDIEILDKKEFKVNPEWEIEGINSNTQNEFQVYIDRKEKRWCFPIFDDNNNLLAFKGRTYVKDFKILNIPKYLYMPFLGTNDVLFNLYKALPYILERNEVIIVESEKSVMKLWQNGIKNAVSISNKKINELLIKKIIKLKCSNVVIALDKDVSEKDIKIECNKLKMFKNTYFILDDENLLGEKDSPIDLGVDIWYDLYNKRRRV